MALENHIEALKGRHAEIESQLKILRNSSSASYIESEITDLKRKKLQIKDKIREAEKS